MFIRSIIYFALLVQFSPKAEAAWPSELNSAVRDQKYGATCRRCTEHFSDGYCAPNCCRSCKSIVANYNITPEEGCDAVCSVGRTITREDAQLNEECKQNDPASNSQCDGATEFLDDGLDPRNPERRQESCDDAVQSVIKNCAESRINSIIPVDVFKLAKRISEAPTCEFDDINKYKVKSPAGNPQRALAECSASFNSCKTYCFDYNTVQGVTYQQGQIKFQDTCQPMFSAYEERIAVISAVKTHIDGCNDGEEPNITPDGGEGNDLTEKPVSDPSTTAKRTGQGADGLASGKSSWSTPTGALNNLNQFSSFVQQFLPQEQSQGWSNQPVVNTPNPYTTKSEPTLEQLYGPEYEGEKDPTSDDLDLESAVGFDQPSNLRNTQSSSNRANQGRGGMGGAAGGFSGSGGAANSANQKGKNSKRGKPPVKDKTLFGKRQSGSGGGSFAGNDSVLKQKTGYRSGLGVAGASADKLKNKKEFNASKYHDQILASYQKGLSRQSKALAGRRSAGFSSEDPNGVGNRGYESWHLENKIHPETVSLFMQMRVCYNKKFTSGFSLSCETGKQ